MKSIFGIKIPDLNNQGDRVNHLNSELSSQQEPVNSALNTINTIEQNKNTIDSLQSASILVQGQLNQSIQLVNEASSQEHKYRLELNGFPGQIALKEKDLKLDQQKLKKLQKLDKLANLLVNYNQATSEITLIKEACVSQNKEALDLLLLKAKDLNCQDHQGKTPLIHALQNSFLYAVDKLLEQGVNLHVKDQQGNNAFHLAILSKKDSIVEKLLKYDQEIAADKDSQGRLPLYLALEQNNPSLIKLLLSESYGGQALVYAITKNNHQIGGALLALQKSLVNFNDANGKSVLSIALEQDRPELSKLLLSCGASLAEALDSNKSIKHVDLSGIKIGHYELASLANELRSNHYIKHLSLKNSQLGPNGSKIISEALSISHSLTYIDLSNNNIGYEGAKFIADALELNNSVLTIDLSSNNIDEAGGVFIATLIAVNNYILKVNLANNNIKDTGAIFISNGLSKNNCLTNIDLSGNSLGDKGAEALVDAIANNVSVTAINLTSNNISTKGINYIAEALKANSSIITPLGIDNQEKYLNTKIVQNQQVFTENLQRIKTTEGDGLFDKDTCSKELFILFKQIQSQNPLFPYQKADNFEQDFYFTKIEESFNHFQSDNYNSEDKYASLLSGQLENLSDI